MNLPLPFPFHFPKTRYFGANKRELLPNKNSNENAFGVMLQKGVLRFANGRIKVRAGFEPATNDRKELSYAL